MMAQRDRTLKKTLDNTIVKLIGLNEWAEGGHPAKYSFIRPATIAVRTYPGQLEPIHGISIQSALASPTEKTQETGEVGPGTARVVSAIPIHTSLVLDIEVVAKTLPFKPYVSVVSILMVGFIVWML